VYVQAGLVRVGYQHFAFLGQESQWSAEASECASEQDAFWDYHDLLFSRQAGENRGAFNQDNLKQFAADLGLNTQAFNACLDSGKYASLVRSETLGAQSIGVTGTPAFMINGRPLVGAQPFEVFQQVIEAELEGRDK
jgi:protein-disulfide isomerase